MTLSHTEREETRGKMAQRVPSREERRVGVPFQERGGRRKSLSGAKGEEENSPKTFQCPEERGGEREKYEVSNAEPALKSSRHFFI